MVEEKQEEEEKEKGDDDLPAVEMRACLGESK
jgi:hypothetical protein